MDKGLMCMDLLELLWAIFIAEGDVKASVPFGWLKRKDDFKKGSVSFRTIMREVAKELVNERSKFDRARKSGKIPADFDFIRYLARIGYNANPSEWDQWEKNVRNALKFVSSLKSLWR